MSSMRGTRCRSPEDGRAAQVLRPTPPVRRAPQQAKAKHVSDLHLGFTGTRHGVTHNQEEGILLVMLDLWKLRRSMVVHHGDCMGADATFYRLARGLDRVRIVCHPPITAYWRAAVGGDEVREPLHPIVRNSVIVRESSWMIAAPREMLEQVRGGTWSTVRRARAWGRPLAIVWRDGSISKERWP